MSWAKDGIWANLALPCGSHPLHRHSRQALPCHFQTTGEDRGQAYWHLACQTVSSCEPETTLAQSPATDAAPLCQDSWAGSI